jgi:hypothetical protein
VKRKEYMCTMRTDGQKKVRDEVKKLVRTGHDLGCQGREGSYEWLMAGVEARCPNA